MRSRRIVLGLLVIWIISVFTVLPALAQGDGQFCVRAFEDRNGNGQRDAGEPLLTRGIGANLLDERGVIVASAIMDNSPTAGQGVICFLGLVAQQYTMVVTSAEYEPTTGDNMTVSVVSGGAPPVLEYGGQRIDAAAVTDTDAATESRFTDEEMLERIFIAGAGALVVTLVMSILGLIIYFIALRRRGPTIPPTIPDEYYRRPSTKSTGQMRVVSPSDTGEYPRSQ